MYGGINIVGTYNVPSVTQTAGTVITALVPPYQAWQGAVPGNAGQKQVYTGLTYLSYTSGATAQTLYVMRPLGFTRLSAAAAASQAVVNIDADPGKYAATATIWGLTSRSVVGGTFTFRTADHGIAANDYVAYQYSDGTWELNTVASVSTLAITLTNNLGTGGLALGTPFYYFGIQTATNPYDGQAHPKFNVFASQAAGAGTIGAEASGGHLPFVAGYGPNNPLVIYSTNATNAITIERATAIYYTHITGVGIPGPFGVGPIPLSNPYPNG